nr:unnamed protein product [Callosobruchus analis]
MYRKKRPDAFWLRDNLKLEKGSFKSLKTEYMRRFKNFYELLRAKNERQPVKFATYPIKPIVSLQLEGDQEFNSNYKESYGKQWLPGLDNPHMDYETKPILIEPASRIRQAATQKKTHSTEIGRRPLLLHGIHGSLHEVRDSGKGATLTHPHAFEVGGGNGGKTENRETFVKYDHVERPPLCKKFTQLHLEGSFDFSTDNMRSYPLHEYQQRPSLVRKSTNLNLEGDLTLTPEYRREYHIPEEKFKTKLQPVIPFLRESSESRGGSRPTSRASSRRGSFKEERHISTYVSKVIF